MNGDEHCFELVRAGDKDRFLSALFAPDGTLQSSVVFGPQLQNVSLGLYPEGSTNGGYRFFFDGAGNQAQIPVFYNGVSPTTPQVENSISATVSVSEGARKDRFDEAVRTENVAIRLRAGVIAEVGPAPSATQGTEGLRVPAGCTPASGTLRCPPAATPASTPTPTPAP